MSSLLHRPDLIVAILLVMCPFVYQQMMYLTWMSAKKKSAVSLVEKYATSPRDYLAHLKQTSPSMAAIWVSCQIVSILSVLYVFFFR